MPSMADSEDFSLAFELDAPAVGSRGVSLVVAPALRCFSSANELIVHEIAAAVAITRRKQTAADGRSFLILAGEMRYGWKWLADF